MRLVTGESDTSRHQGTGSSISGENFDAMKMSSSSMVTCATHPEVTGKNMVKTYSVKTNFEVDKIIVKLT